MNKLKFTNVSNNIAVMNLRGDIGGEVNGHWVADDIQYLNKYRKENGVTEIKMYINSMGGHVIDGISICSEMLNSEIPVTTVISGMAYSIAGVIAMCGHNREMTDYSSFMMHDVSGGNGNDEVLDLLTNSLAKIFEGTTPLTLENARQMMSRETWMSPSECEEMGLIHKVIPTEIKKPKLENVELYEFYNKLLIKPEEMLKIKNELNLNDNASEELAVEKIVELKNEADVLKSEKNEVELELKNLKQDHKDLELKIEDFDNKAIEVEKTAKEELLNKAVADKKISESTKEAYANSDMDSKVLGTLIDGIKVKPKFKKVSEEVEARNSARSEWNYSKWEQEDPKGLEDLANNFKEEYERLVKTIGTTMKSKI